MMKKQKCTKCGKPSIPGLFSGSGKCQYHWNEGVWGKKWADECERRRRENAEQEQNRRANMARS